MVIKFKEASYHFFLCIYDFNFNVFMNHQHASYLKIISPFSNIFENTE